MTLHPASAAVIVRAPTRTPPPTLALTLALLLLAPAGIPAASASPPVPVPVPVPVQRKIACIGDSITEGSGLPNPTLESYPARLQRLVRPRDIVRNYGVSGRTLLKKGDFPYWKESAYTASHTWNPDVVLIKLGSNDAKPQNWRYGTNFVAELEELVATYRTLPSQPRVILCTPAPVYGSGAFSISPGVVATNIAPAVRDIALRLGLDLIDFHERLAGHPEWFPDTIHPNTSGAAVMAAIAFQALDPDSPTPNPPTLTVSRSPAPANRAVLAWPAPTAAFVLQTAPRLGTPAAWTVATPVPTSDGSTLRLTNAAGPRFFRLWLP